MDKTGNQYFVYVLNSEKHDRIYIGQTNNLAIRLQKHNSGNVKSTTAYAPWKIVHVEIFRTRSGAMLRGKTTKIP